MAIRADDSASRIVNGGAVEPMREHPSIRMIKETVDMKLGAKVGWQWPVFVRCQFFLKNNGPAVDVYIGFPEIAAAGGDTAAVDRLIGFKSWVDGKPIEVKYMPSSKNKKESNSDYYMDYKAWYVKKVHFNTGQTHRIVDVYSARLGYENQAASIEGTVSNFVYILKSGASWQGTIGNAVIRADLADANDFYDISAQPKSFSKQGSIITWILKDFDPKDNIAINLTPRLPLLNGKKVFAHVWEPCFVRNGILMVAPSFAGDHVVKNQPRGEDKEIRYGNHLLVLKAGSMNATLDGKRIKLHTAPIAGKQDDEFAVPLDEIVRILGGSVKYDKNHRANVILPLAPKFIN